MKRFRLFIAALAAAIAASATAADRIWDGDTSVNWNDAANWDTGKPVNNDVVIFTGTTTLTNNNNTAGLTALGGVQLRGDDWYISGTALTLNPSTSYGIAFSNAAATASATNTWLINLTLGTNGQTWTNVQGTLLVGGTVANNGGGWTLTGPGSYVFTNVLAGNRTFNNQSTVTLAGTAANTMNGAYVIDGGTLLLNKTAGLNAIAGTAVTITNGGLVRLLNDDQIIDTAILTIRDGSTFDVNGRTEMIKYAIGTGGISLNSGTLILNTAANGTTFDGIISNDGTLVFTNTIAFNLNNPGNNFANLVLAGTPQASAGTVQTTTNVNGTPFGVGNVTIQNGTLSFAPATAGDVVFNIATNSGATVTYGLNSVIKLARKSPSSLTVTAGTAGASSVLVRDGNGALVINYSAANLLGGSERFFVLDNVPTLNGIVSPSIVGQAGSTVYDFLAYNAADGFTNATYDLVNPTSGGSAASKLFNSSATTLAGNLDGYVARADAALNLAGNQLTLGDGTTPTALILNNTVVSNGTIIVAGNQEFLVPVNGTGIIAADITGTGLLNKFGVGTLVLSNADLYAGPILIQAGTLTLNPTVDRAFTNSVTGLGSLVKDGAQRLTISNTTINLPAGTVSVAGGGTLMVSNTPVTARINVGGSAGSQSNTLWLTGASTVWNAGGGPIAVGNLNSTGNVFRIADGAVVTNAGGAESYIGYSGAGGFGNVLSVTNGGQLFLQNPTQRVLGIGGTSNRFEVIGGPGMISRVDLVGSLTLGSYAGSTTYSTGNVMWVDGGGTSGGAVVTGGASLGIAGFANQLVITNGGQVTLGVFGFSGASNLIRVVGAGSYAGFGASAFSINGTDNQVWIESGGTVTNALLSVGGSGYQNNSMVVTNGGKFFQRNDREAFVGTGGSNNWVLVSGVGSLWDNNNFNGKVGALTIGSVAGATGNWVRVEDSAVMTNFGTVTVGAAGSFGNYLVVTNGGKLFSTRAATIGNGSSNNWVFIGGNGALWDLGNQTLSIGSGAATGNVLTVDGGVVQRIGSLILTTAQNEVRLWGGTLSAANAYITNNSLVVGDGQGAGATFGLLGGSIYAGGTGYFAVTNDGTLSGYGALQQSFTNLGYVVARGGGLTQTVDAVMYGTGTNIAANTGTLVLRADNSALNSVNLLDGGTILVTNDNNLGSDSAVLRFTSNGGTLAIGAGAPASFATLRHVTLNGAGAFDITGGVTAVWGGALSGSGSLTKAGSGTLNLTNLNTYTGTTAVRGGILQVNGTLSAGGDAVTVYSGGMLQGTGTIYRAVTVLSNGLFSAGNSPGTMTVSNFTLNGNGIFLWEAANLETGVAGTDWDLLIVSNQFVFSGGSASSPYIFDLQASGNYSNGAQWTMATAAGGFVGWDPSAISLVQTSFVGGGLGYFTITLDDTTNLNLHHVAGAIWTNGNGNWSQASKWSSAPTAPDSGTLTYLVFTNQAGGYTASNDVASFTVNRILLTNAAGHTIKLTGGQVVFDGSTPWLVFDSTGESIISNELFLAQHLRLTNTVNNSGTLYLAGSLTGSNGFTKGGNYHLHLQGANSFTGAVAISGGSVAIYGANSFGHSGNTVSLSGTTLILTNTGTGYTVANSLSASGNTTLSLQDSAGSVVLAGTVAGSGALTVSNRGTVTLTGAVTHSGSLVNTGGTLVVAGSVFAPGTVANNSMLVFSNSSSLGVAGVVSGTGSLTMRGSGTTSLSATNTYSGGTWLRGGTLAVADTNNLGTGNLTFSNGTLLVTAGGTFDRAAVLDGAGTLSVGSGASLSWSGALSGDGAVTKAGSGTLVFGADQSYSGDTLVRGGALLVNATLASGASTVTVASGAVLGGAGTVNRAVVLSSGGTLSPGASGALSIGTLTTSNLVWNGGGAYRWDINSGTGNAGAEWDLLRINGTLALTNDATPFVIAMQTLDGTVAGQMANFGSANLTWQILTASGGISNFSATTFQIDATEFLNPNTGAFGLSVENGTNLLLSYSAAFVWTNTLGGNREWTTASYWEGGLVATSGYTTAILFRGDGIASNNNAGTFVANRLSFDLASGSNQTVVGGALEMNGFAAPRIDQLNAGTATVANDLILSNRLYLGGTGSGTLTLSGQISGDHGLTRETGTGWTLVLGGSNSFSGAVQLLGGQTRISSDYAFGAPGNAVVLSNATLAVTNDLAAGRAFTLANAVLDVEGESTYTVSGALNGLSATSLVKSNTGTLAFTGGGSVAGQTILKDGTLRVGGGSWGAISNAGGTLLFDPSNTATISGNISGQGGIMMNGSGTLFLHGINTNLDGGLAIQGGTVAVNSDHALGASGAAVTITNGATLRATASYTSSRTLTSQTGGAVLSVDPAVTNLWAGTISGSGGLTKSGSGLLELTAVNDYNGTTLINAGTLRLNGTLSAGGGAVTVGGGTLAGTGTISRAVLLQNGGTISAGHNGPGTLTLDSLSWQQGGTYLWSVADFDAANAGQSTSWSLLDVTGLLSFSSGANPFVLDLRSTDSAFASDDKDAWLIATAGSVSGFDRELFSISTANFGHSFSGAFGVSNSNGEVWLTYAPAYVWTNTANGVLTWDELANNWQALAPPPSDQLDTALLFQGHGIASNVVPGFVVNHLIFEVAANQTQVLAGSSVNLHGYTAPRLTQNGAGLAEIRHGLVLSNTLAMAGGGSGTVTLAGPISGAYGFTKTGSWSLVLSGANSFTGTVSVIGGGLVLEHASALGWSGNTASLNNVSLAVNVGSLSNALVLANTVSVTNQVGGTVTLLGGLSGSGVLSQQVQTLVLGGSNSATYSGTVALPGGGALVFSNQAGTLTFSGVITGAGSLTKTANGTLSLGGANSYTGDTRIEGGILVANDSLALGTATSAVSISNAANYGALGLLFGNGVSFGREVQVIDSGSAAARVGSDSGTATLSGQLTLGDDVVLYANANSRMVFTGLITNTTALVSVVTGGGGVIELAGTNKLSNGLTVNSATLMVNDITGVAAGLGTITVSSSGTLAGNGLVANTSLEGGTVAPGDFGVGELTLVNSTWTNATRYTWDLADTAKHDQNGGSEGTDWDFLTVSNLTLAAGSYTVNINADVFIPGDTDGTNTYRIGWTDVGNWSNGTWAVNWLGANSNNNGFGWWVTTGSGGQDLYLNYGAGEYNYDFLVIPEPNVLLLWLSSLATIYAARRRLRGKSAGH